MRGWIGALLIAWACTLCPARAQAPEVIAATERALAQWYPPPSPVLTSAESLPAIKTSALGCKLVAGLPLSAPLEVYRVQAHTADGDIALHVSADGSLVQACNQDFINLGAGVLPWSGPNADSDGDGAPDASDQCPSLAGIALGCPLPGADDSDGDGLADAEDRCPLQAGGAQFDGCPLLRDRDVDGAPDHIDLCPDQAGIIRRDFALGCPADGSGASSRQRAQNETCHIAVASAPIYSSPDAKSQIIGRLIPTLSEAEHSAVAGRAASGPWYKIAQGWARASALSGPCYNIPLLGAPPGGPTGCFLRARGQRVNAREAPGGRIVARLGRGETLAVLGANRRGDWVFYRAGWIRRDVLALSGTCDELPTLDPAYAGSGIHHFCPPGYAGFLKPRIEIGRMTAQVASAASANRLRAAPDASSQLVGEIPPGAVVDAVLDGPACNGGFVWWQVKTDGRVGWTVESSLPANYYYLQPSPADSRTKRDPRRVSTTAATTRVIHSANAGAIGVTHALPLASPRAIAWSRNGRLLAAIDGGGGLALFSGDAFAPFDTRAWSSPLGELSALAFSPDESRLALGGGDGRVAVARLREDGSLADLATPGALDGRISGLAWAGDDALAAVSGEKSLKLARRAGTLIVWDFADGSARMRLRQHFPYPITAVAFSRGGRWLAASGESSGDARAGLWIINAASGELAHSKPLIPMAGAGVVSASPMTALGDFVYSSGDSLYHISAASGAQTRFYHQAGGVIEALSIRPGVAPGAEVLIAIALRDRGEQRQLRIFNALNARSPETALELEAATLAFRPDGKALALAEYGRANLLILGVGES